MISVIIPCYNQGSYLAESLESVFNQTYEEWECLIINDGSLDSTEEIALRWKAKDKRFRYFKKENGGLSASRNLGLRNAIGKYIQFLDADDVIDKNKLFVQVKRLERSSDSLLAYCDYFCATGDNLYKEFPRRYIQPEFKSENYIHELITNWQVSFSIPCHCFLFRADLFRANNIFFNETLPNHEDWECWMNIFALNPGVIYVDEKLATYRIHNNAMSSERGQMKEGFLKAISLQKNKYKVDPELFSLLNTKFNLVKYGYPSTSPLKALIFGIVIRLSKKVRRRILKIAGKPEKL